MAEHIRDEYFVTRDVVTYNGSALVSDKKNLVVEVSYQLYVNGRGAGEMICSPWDKKEAFLGYLYLRGYISSAGDVRAIDVDEEHGMVNITIREYLTDETGMENLLLEDEVLLNGQGIVPKRDDVRLSVSEVLAFSRELEERSALFHRTGGVHCAAFVHHGVFLSYKEDVSHHVAVDKVVGDCLLRKIPMKDGIFNLLWSCSGGNPAKSRSHGLFHSDRKVGTDELFLSSGTAAWDYADRFCQG